MTDATKTDPDAPSHERLLPGGNQPPLEERLPLDYADDVSAVETVAARATAAPKSISDDDELAQLTAIVKDARALVRDLEKKRTAEKAPFDKAAKTVHDFFKTRQDRMETVQTALNKRITIYLDAKAAAEKAAREAEARRQREAEEARRREADAQLAAAREAERARQAAEAAAERARQAEAQAAAAQAEGRPDANVDVEETRRAAAAAAQRAEEEERRVDAAVATAAANRHADEARKAEIAAAAKPADLGRTRTDAGLATLQSFADFEVEDWDAVSLVRLRPFLKQEHIEMAIRAFVKTHGTTQTLPGVRIFTNTRSTVR